eukprot:INCI6973.1.p1 GENE.INCI6973.1~~INCI6973.1.p1  ORF type:complete len:234 (+),score=36.06 INCI6973.1:206-907(+)
MANVAKLSTQEVQALLAGSTGQQFLNILRAIESNEVDGEGLAPHTNSAEDLRNFFQSELDCVVTLYAARQLHRKIIIAAGGQAAPQVLARVPEKRGAPGRSGLVEGQFPTDHCKLLKRPLHSKWNKETKSFDIDKRFAKYPQLFCRAGFSTIVKGPNRCGTQTYFYCQCNPQVACCRQCFETVHCGRKRMRKRTHHHDQDHEDQDPDQDSDGQPRQEQEGSVADTSSRAAHLK